MTRRCKHRRKRGTSRHKRLQKQHAAQRLLERYPWVTLEDGERIRTAVVEEMRERRAKWMWGGAQNGGRGRGLGSYAVTFEGRMYFVGYDQQTGQVTTWFPRTDPRVQEWVLKHYGADAVRTLFNDSRE